MLATRQLTSRLLTQASRIPKSAPQTLRLLSTTPVLQGKDPKMSSSPPKHEMVYFPQLTSEVRAFGQFRKVLHTGLFSQLVSMEIPVGGDIGDEVHTVDQVLIFTSGEGKATVAGKDQVSFQFIVGKPSITNIAHRTSKHQTSSSCPLVLSTSSSTHRRLSRWSL
jgi:mannose-6-phosphate isomerase-like protein (cupin superfamily)